MEQNYLIYLLEAVVTTIVLGTIAIPLLKKLKARQSVREEGPKSHRSKNGTPTMGGIFMILSAVLVLLFNKILDPAALWLLFLTLGHGILGFLDDFIKAEKKRNLGLTAKQKMLGQIILAVLFCWGVVDTLHLPFSIAIPFTNIDIYIGAFYYIFIIPCNWMDCIGVWVFSVFHLNYLFKFRLVIYKRGCYSLRFSFKMKVIG